MLLAVSATFATEDVDLVSADVDETILEEVVAVEDDSATLSEVSDDSEIHAQDSSDDLKEGGESSNTVTNATFFDYFDESGTLKDSVTSDELIFEGTFENLPDVNYLTIDKSIKLTGKDATFKNVAFVVGADNVAIDGFNIVVDSSEVYAITISASNINISNNKIDIVGIEGDDAYAIYASYADKLLIYNNDISFVGKAKGGNKTNVIYVESSEDVVIEKNKFNINMVSSASDPETYEFLTEGFVFSSSINLIFKDNAIDLKYTGTAGFYDTINVIDVGYNSDNAVIKGNTIVAVGGTYIYGIKLYANNFSIENNNFDISSEIQYANGINPEAASTGVVNNNTISVSAPIVVYGIYSGMYAGMGNLDVNYTDNTISGSAYAVFGLELTGANEIAKNNKITLNGNYSTGIASSSWNLTLENNVIECTSNNLGYTYVWEDFGVEAVGIKFVRGNATLVNNNVKTNYGYAVNITTGTAKVANNYLIGKSTVGDKSVIANGDANVFDNTPALKIILFATDLTKTEGDSAQFTVAALDENGEALANKTITITINSKAQNATTNDKGIASFNIDLAAGTYTVESAFAGDDTYGPKSITNSITVNAKPVAPATPKVTKKATKITASKKTFKAKTKTKKYTITLKSGKTLIKSAKVYLKIGKKTFKATTNKNGKATFKITKLTKKGKYTAKITYKGSSTYKASSKSVKITVKK